MLRPDRSQRNDLLAAAKLYHANLPVVAPYLEERGIPEPVAEAFRLGYVAEPYSTDHKPFVGRLSIPYLTRAGVVTIRFRCTEKHNCKTENCAKYLGAPGSEALLYNVESLFSTSEVLVITEGELDAIICSAMVGVPAVGIPGVSSWKPHWTLAVADFPTVLVAADGDDAGTDMVSKVCGAVRQARGRQFPPGKDLTDLYLESSREAVLDVLGLPKEN